MPGPERTLTRVLSVPRAMGRVGVAAGKLGVQIGDGVALSTGRGDAVPEGRTVAVGDAELQAAPTSVRAASNRMACFISTGCYLMACISIEFKMPSKAGRYVDQVLWALMLIVIMGTSPVTIKTMYQL